jgi:hypothetical protein
MRTGLLTISLLLTLIAIPALKADEGMWIPILIEKYNIKLMQEKGFKLSAEDIYSVNKASMKDAIVLFGGGCTAELISPGGLLITNHHCGYDEIQRHSSLTNDYLTNGFWAMSGKEELPNPGLTVTFLKRMEDVTLKVLKGIKDGMSPSANDKIMSSNILEIRKMAEAGTGYSADVKPFFMGNQYFLFLYETFRDIRLVGAPPSAIGKFGGETDNWIWPRHTGDFSLFRIYADKNNKPADYSEKNIPYKPSYYFPVSLKGVNEGDFTMVFGYPGTTYEYVPSYHIYMINNQIYPRMIAIRTKKIDIMEAAMNSDPLIRIQYSAKKSGIANSWKKWIGESQGLERMKTIEKKQEYEKRITKWIESDSTRLSEYGNILPRYGELYGGLKDYYLVKNFTNEVFFRNSAEVFSLASSLISLSALYENHPGEKEIKYLKDSLIASARNFFKDYSTATDKKLFVAVLTMYGDVLDSKWLAPEYIKLKKVCNGDFSSIVDKLYKRSVFTDETKFCSFVASFSESSVRKLKNDPFYTLAVDVSDFLKNQINPELNRINSELGKLNKTYMAAQMEFDKDRVFYPDANLTLRVAYGQVKGYKSRDAAYFTYYTTLSGIMEKYNPDNYDYNVPEKLKELYQRKDYGRYTQDGEVPVCFIANNHTTGGNSGSPVINSEGNLIGVNFDRVWEGVASDIAFNPDQSRNISLDIRYALFIIDKFAGAGYLLNEMTIIE